MAAVAAVAVAVEVVGMVVEEAAVGTLAAAGEDSAVATRGAAAWAVLALEAQHRPAARSVGIRGPGEFAAIRGLPVRSVLGARGECGLRRGQELAAWDLVVRGARSSPITQVPEATSPAEPEQEIRSLAETVADSAVRDLALGAADSDTGASGTVVLVTVVSVMASAAAWVWV